MPDFCSTYQHAVVSMVEAFLKEIEELTSETKGRLSKLGEFSKLTASIEKDKGEVKDTSRVHDCIALIQSFLTGLLFGCYMELLTKVADSFSMIKDLENKQKEDKSFQLPEVMQLRVDSFKHYLKKATERLEVIDKALEELIAKVYEAKGKRFELSDQEMAHLEMNTAKVNRSLEACKKYLDEAENEIKNLESDIASEMKRFKMKTAAITSGIGAMLMLGGAYFVPADILKLPLKEVAQKLGFVRGGLLVGGTAAALQCYCVCYSVIIDNHRHLFTPHLEKLKEELKKVKTEYEIMKKDFEKDVTGNMGTKH